MQKNSEERRKWGTGRGKGCNFKTERACLKSDISVETWGVRN